MHQAPYKVILATFAPFVGGAEVALERLALGLLEAGHLPLIAVGRKGEVLERYRALRLPCVHVRMALTDKWRFWDYLRARSALARLFADECPHLVHANDLPTHQMVSQAAHRTGIPRLCHHRFIFPGEALDWMNKYGAERHVYVSQALMAEIGQRSSQLASAPREVVYDGLPLPSLPSPEERREARRQLDLPLDRLIVNFSGQIIKRKGVAELLRAWAILAPRWGEKAVLVIVGDDLEKNGDYRRQMESLAGELGIQAQFAGFRKDVARWLCASDFAVVPSHVEPLGNATLEAMAMALPVVGASVGGIPEMIVNDETGLLVPAKDPERLAQALDRLLEDASLRNCLGMAARRRCEEKFSVKAHTDAMCLQYDAILHGSGNGQRRPLARAIS
jgi:glycosyltransferase involved in cell wall biosynthesis